MEKTPLHNILLDRINRSGQITFAEFMASALYEPGLGYYTSPGRKVGAEGDFFTSITVHAAFGRVIAREIIRMWRSMGSPDRFTLVEAGAGHGRLSMDILTFIAENAPDCYATVNLVLVEKEPSLAEAQATLLSPHREKLGWLAPEELATGFSFTGVLYSNELLDAMPVHRVMMTADGLRELFVTSEGDQFREQLDTTSSPAIETYFTDAGIKLHNGQQAEVSLAALDWFKHAASCLDKGYILTIDYGWPDFELYAPQRKLGTLLCYHRHKVEDNPYERIGEQDITTHVNFSAIIRLGEAIGLDTVWFGEQYRFLLSAGMMEEFEAIERSDSDENSKMRTRMTLKRLIMPEGGMGDTFRILIQSKGVDNPQLGCLKGI
jgi:SAM-dependent MidA family methyltransferase